MDDPHEITIGTGGDVDGHDGHQRYLGRASETEWFVGRYVGGALARVATIEQRAGRDGNWLVRPVSPLYDDDEYDTWAEARRAAFQIEPRP